MVAEQHLLRQEIEANLNALPHQVSRVFHGRGRFFPALEDINVEWYPPVLFVQCYEGVLSEACHAALEQVFNIHAAIETVVVQSRPWPDVDNDILFTRSPVTFQIFWCKGVFV